MKCPHCGYEENRPDSKYCKKCGKPLQVQPAPSAAAPVASADPSACPHCGSPVKPGARFCPRCGQSLQPAPVVESLSQPATTPSPDGYVPPAAPPLQTTEPAMPTPPPAVYAAPTQPSMGSGQQYAAPPASPPPVQPVYAVPPTVAPPPGPPSLPTEQPPRKNSNPPNWLWMVLGALLAFCLLVTVAAIVLRGSWLPLIRGEPSPTPTTEATSTPPAQPAEGGFAPTPPVVIAPTVTPTLTLQANVALIVSAEEVVRGDYLTATIVITNTGTVEIAHIHYELAGVDSITLHSEQPLVRDSDVPIQPGASDRFNFRLRAIQTGRAALFARIGYTPADPSLSQIPQTGQSNQTDINVR